MIYGEAGGSMIMGNFTLGIIEAAPAVLVGKSDKKNKSIDKQKITRHNQTGKDNNEAGQE